jgi:hypothetical protein
MHVLICTFEQRNHECTCSLQSTCYNMYYYVLLLDQVHINVCITVYYWSKYMVNWQNRHKVELSCTLLH